jgi:hypothetical protein
MIVDGSREKLDISTRKWGKYMVRFTDGDEDFVGLEEIDGVEIILL